MMEVEPSSNSYFTKNEITSELHKIVSDCDHQCEFCCSLVRQLSTHVARNHGQTPIRKYTRKRKKNFDEDKVYSSPSVNENLSKIIVKTDHSYSADAANNSPLPLPLLNLKIETPSAEEINEDIYIVPDQHFTPDGNEINKQDEPEPMTINIIMKPKRKRKKVYKYQKKPKYKFICRKCKQGFKEKDEFNDHLKIHEEEPANSSQGEGSIMCGICEQVFSIIADLTEHVRTKHQLAGLHKCHVCEIQFNWRELTQHFELYHPDQLPFACNACVSEPKLTFPTRKDLDVHERIVHTKKKVFPCDQCPRICLSGALLNTHSLVHENGRKPFVCEKCGWSCDTLSELNSHTPIHVPKKNFICSVENCGCRFTTQTVLDAHVLLFHEKTGETISNSEQNEVKNLRPFACRTCTRAYSNFANLLLHLQQRHGHDAQLEVSKSKCYVCKSKFINAIKLRQHMRNEHPNHKQFCCEICNQEFSRGRALDLHVRSKHTRELPFVCPFCQMRFLVSRNMDAHIANHHTMEKPYKCDQCDKAYSYRTHLTSHRLMHEGKKPYMCAECGKCFGSQKNLHSHSTIHKRKRNAADGNGEKKILN